jgi:hypothetical protein
MGSPFSQPGILCHLGNRRALGALRERTLLALGLGGRLLHLPPRDTLDRKGLGVRCFVGHSLSSNGALLSDGHTKEALW